MFKNKIYNLKNNINLKLKKLRPEQDSNPECPVLESSTLTITPEKTNNRLTRLTIARLMSDNVNKVKNIIKFLIINFPYQPT